MKQVFELYKPEREVTRAQLIDELAAMPARLRGVAGALGADALVAPAADGGWSPLDVCKHMRDIVQVYGLRFKWMILDNDPVLPNYDEDRWVAESPEGAAELDALLDEITAHRAETVRLLRALAPDGWSRTGRHEVHGSVELEAYVRHEYAHEEQHLAQLGAGVGAAG